MTTSGNAAETRTLSCREIEHTVCRCWSELFGRDVSPYDDFFDLGGDSLSILDMVDTLRTHGIPVRSSEALRHPTPARLAECLTVRSEDRSGASELPALRPNADTAATRSWAGNPGRPVPIVTGGAGEPLVVLHSDSHTGAERAAANRWRGGRPVLGLPVPGVSGEIPPPYHVVDLAGRHRAALLHAQPDGPYHLVGFGHSAVVAFELARQLRHAGRVVALLALVRPLAVGPTAGPQASLHALLDRRLSGLARRFALTGRETPDETLARLRDGGWYDATVRPGDLPRLQVAGAELARAVAGYIPRRYDGPTLLVRDETDPSASDGGWGEVAADLRTFTVHYGLEAPLPAIGDEDLATWMRAELTPTAPHPPA